jgi:hypothetical protein
MSYRVTFRYFADWFRSVTPNPSGPGAVSEAFNAYKIEYARRQLLVVFEDNKRQAWFKDRYDPSKEAVEARKITRTQGRAGKMESFMDKVNRGELDDISFEQPVADPKPIEFKAVESKPVEEIESKPIEEEDKMDVDSDEVEQLLLGSSTAVIPTGPAKRSGMEVDEQTSTRQLFIKMIPVNLSRKQLEQVSHVSLSFRSSIMLTIVFDVISIARKHLALNTSHYLYQIPTRNTLEWATSNSSLRKTCQKLPKSCSSRM